MANLITVVRTLLAFLAVAMLRWHKWEIYVGAALLTLLLIWMDAWDGWVARRRNEASKVGAVFDIRALALERGLTAFGTTSMMRSPLGALLVSSRFTRGAYGFGKAAAFTLVILAFAPGWHPSLKATLVWTARAKGVEESASPIRVEMAEARTTPLHPRRECKASGRARRAARLCDFHRDDRDSSTWGLRPFARNDGRQRMITAPSRRRADSA